MAELPRWVDHFVHNGAAVVHHACLEATMIHGRLLIEFLAGRKRRDTRDVQPSDSLPGWEHPDPERLRRHPRDHRPISRPPDQGQGRRNVGAGRIPNRSCRRRNGCYGDVRRRSSQRRFALQSAVSSRPHRGQGQARSGPRIVATRRLGRLISPPGVSVGGGKLVFGEEGPPLLHGRACKFQRVAASSNGSLARVLPRNSHRRPRADADPRYASDPLILSPS